MTAKAGLEAAIRRVPMRWSLGALACLCCLPTAMAGNGFEDSGASQPLEHLTLVVPSTSGSGWDLTARAMKQVLESEGIAQSVEIADVPGSSGLAGLAQFVGARRGDGHYLLVGGMFMVGAAVSKHAVAALNDLIPVAQLTSDADVVVVPASSPYRSLDDLLDAMRRNPQAMRWAGASVGGSDHPTMWQLARAAGVAPELMRYESFPDENDVAAQVAGGRFSAGIDGYSAFDGFIRSGQLRGLAMVSRQPLDGVNIPTFRQLGIVGVSIANWCGAFAPPAISDSERARIESAIQQMVQSSDWRPALKRLHLRNAYLDAADFSQLLRQEERRIAKSEATTSAAPNLWLRELRVEGLLALAAGVAALVSALRWEKLSARRREEKLRQALREVSEEVERRTREALQRTQDMAAVRVGMHAQIEREFNRWALTGAERSVAHLMLKGLRLKDIARARNTSDRTVRQQAQAIYRKAGLDGRTDLAAYFLESVLDAPELEGRTDGSSAIAASATAGVARLRVSARMGGVSTITGRNGPRGAVPPPAAISLAAADSR